MSDYTIAELEARLAAARAELARWVEDWGKFTPGECGAGIHPDFAFDHGDSVTCPICAAETWKSEHDLSVSITHQLQVETGRLEAELAAANARCAELEAQGTKLADGLHTWKEESLALQATLDRVTALADEWDRTQIIGNNTYADELRAALTPEGKP